MGREQREREIAREKRKRWQEDKIIGGRDLEGVMDLEDGAPLVVDLQF